MKKNFLLATLLFAAAISACKKDESPPEGQLEFEVVEKDINTPLAGATIEGYDCSDADFRGNCRVLGQRIASTTTNTEGKAFFAKSLGVRTLVIRKENYWSLEKFPVTLSRYALTPVALMKTRFIKANQYPVNNSLYVEIILDPSNALVTSRSLGLPADTTIYLQGVGNEMNGVSWMVGPRADPPFNHSQLVYIKKFDTAAFVIQY